MELKIRTLKYRKRRLKFEAQAYGYCSIQEMADWDIFAFQDRLPKTSRLVQNVSLDGLTTDEATPSY